MTMRMMGVIAAVTLAAGAVQAQAPAGPTMVRGKVAALSANTLTVKPDKGPNQIVTLTPTWSVAVMKPVTIDAIQPGSFIGTACLLHLDRPRRCCSR